MTLFISNAEVEQVLDMPTCVARLEAAYRELDQGRGINRPRTQLYFPEPSSQHPGFNYRFKSQEGGTPSCGVWALRITSDMAGFETLPTGEKRRRLLAVGSGGLFCGFIILFSLEKIEPVALIHDSYIQKFRVAATTALGVRELARPEASILALFGSGWQAGAHLEAIHHVRPLREVRVYSPTAAHRQRFAAEVASRYPFPIRTVSNPADGIRGADLVQAATASVDAVFDGHRLEPGQYVGCICASDRTQKRREIDDHTTERADVKVLLSRADAELNEQMETMGPIRRGTVSWEDFAELGELLNGKRPGRTAPHQITLFNNNVGMGVQFAAVGSVVLERCRERGLGREVPTEWFLEATSP